jgi:hypothetical protein
MSTINKTLFSNTRIWGFTAMATLAVSLSSCALPQATYRQQTQAQSQQQVVYQQNYNPPPWAPQYVSYSTARYYYLPDYQMYYDAQEQMYWYQNNGVWYSSYSLPGSYSGANLYTTNVIYLDRDISRPWMNHDYYASHYPRRDYDRNGHDQRQAFNQGSNNGYNGNGGNGYIGYNNGNTGSNGQTGSMNNNRSYDPNAGLPRRPSTAVTNSKGFVNLNRTVSSAYGAPVGQHSSATAGEARIAPRQLSTPQQVVRQAVPQISSGVARNNASAVTMDGQQARPQAQPTHATGNTTTGVARSNPANNR